MNRSYREQFDSALACNTKEEAELWMEKEVDYYVKKYGESPTEAASIIKTNLGYMAGYYDDDSAKKIHHLFNAVHPIFGTSTYHLDMTAKEAFELGKKRGKGDCL